MLYFEQAPYSYDALEPYIDRQTMEIHHSKHHKTYYDKLMEAIRGSKYEGMALEDMLANSTITDAIRNNGGGFYNHNLFWKCLSSTGNKPQGKLLNAIEGQFGSYEDLQEKMTQAGIGRFGSGFVWLIKDSEGKLRVISTANQNNPLMHVEMMKGLPLFCIDVWEHAYYLKYQNRRPAYLEAFWQIADWNNAEKIFLA